MEEEKTPVEGVEENEEIDIYLFSNGQQYSPPRKYHLRVEEIKNSWEATLSFLARSQYGSLHSSIQLYELDGRKLENPTDIRDCAVYVAVVPPDPFLYTGYDKYLVKATRSYERRLSKILDGEQQSGVDANPPTQNVKITPAVGDNEIRPQYPNNIRNTGEVRRSSLKNSSQKLMERIKPVANQVSQRPRKSNVNSKKDGPKITSRISTPGTPGKSSTSGRAGSIVKPKSPAKTLSFDTSIRKGDVTNQKFVNSKHDSFNIHRKIQDSANKINTLPSLKISKQNNNTSTTQKEHLLTGTRHPIVDEILNQHFKNPNISINNTKKSVNDIPKPTIKQRNSTISKISPLKVDNKLQPTRKDRIISWTDAKQPPTADQIHGPVHPIPTSSNETRIQELTSNAIYSTANRTSVSNMIRELNNKLNVPITNGIPKTTKTNQVSVVSENKLTASEDMFVPVNNHQSPIISNNSKSVVNLTVTEKTDDSLTSAVKNENSVTLKLTTASNENENNVLVPEEILLKTQNDVHIVTNSPAVLIKSIPTKNSEINSSKLQELSDMTFINKTKNSQRDDSIKANLDLISILNEARVSTEPQSFILKSEEAPSSKSKERLIIINETIKQASKPRSNFNYIMQKSRTLALYESAKINTEPIALDDKIKVSIVEATPKHEYIDISLVNKENKTNTPSKSPSNICELQINSKESSVTENVHELKVPMLYHVPEKTLNLISHHGIAVKDTASTLSTDIIIKTEDPDSTKSHSFTFYIKKDSDNTLKTTDMKSNLKKETEKIPITNIVKDKDIIHVNIFKNISDNATSTSIDIKDKTKQYNIRKCKDEENNNMKDDCPLEGNQYPDDIPLKEADMSTILINPAWDKNSTNVALKTSKMMTCDETESDTDQFIAIVQNGDIVNIKLSIKIKDAAGLLKSTHQINNTSSVNQLASDEINKTPNELMRSKSLQSVENDSPPHLCCRNKDKVVVYQCACCESTNYTLAGTSLNPSLPGLYVLLPVVASIQESVKTSNQTSDKQVQHTESLTKVSLISSVKETVIGIPSKNVQSKVSEISSKRQVSVDQGVIRSQLIMMRTEPSQTSSHFNTDSKIQQTNRTTQDKFTQTDWCDVLLEARAEPDGHYTFYLPPLHLLQQYCLR